ncbi:hypothetical protein E5Q_03440 [Mixia osmundae IAM 14324]|uniref:Uncharacterized protein n=1 Tax=Mixia osmundae (strain CBS 9802 / IAM 14324 / JCM 22182 / KY 12970) TaxID=764103 RepID=G7E1Q9_MIXOS|nr:hypothetical protein E5Q_03440 [Mixia osmundae IAM 14324]
MIVSKVDSQCIVIRSQQDRAWQIDLSWARISLVFIVVGAGISTRKQEQPDVVDLYDGSPSQAEAVSWAPQILACSLLVMACLSPSTRASAHEVVYRRRSFSGRQITTVQLASSSSHRLRCAAPSSSCVKAEAPSQQENRFPCSPELKPRPPLANYQLMRLRVTGRLASYSIACPRYQTPLRQPAAVRNSPRVSASAATYFASSRSFALAEVPPSIERPARTLQMVESSPSISLDQHEQILLDQLDKFCTLLRTQRSDLPPIELRVAGGWVRDKLLGLPSSDLDISTSSVTGFQFAQLFIEYLHSLPRTDATGSKPPTIAKIEANPDQSKHLETAKTTLYGLEIDFVQLRSEEYGSASRIPSEVVFGTPLQDALRRDITINTLFYNVHTRQVEDHTGKGLDDLRAGRIRTPLEPSQTFMDDPLRVLRCVRFGSRFGYTLDPSIVAAVKTETIREAVRTRVSKERVGIELDKMLKAAEPLHAFEIMDQLDLLPVIFSFPRELAITVNELENVSVLAAARYLRQVLEQPGPQRRLLETIRSDSIALKKLWLAISLIPFRHSSFQEKNKTVALVDRAIGYCLKLGNDDRSWEVAIFAAVAAMQRLSRDPNEDDTSERVRLGTTLREYTHPRSRTMPDWRTALLLADVINCATDPPQDTAWIARLAGRVEALHLDGDAYAKPLLDGKQICEALGIKPSKSIGALLNQVVAWQLDHPGATTDECRRWLVSAHADGSLNVEGPLVLGSLDGARARSGTSMNSLSNIKRLRSSSDDGSESSRASSTFKRSASQELGSIHPGTSTGRTPIVTSPGSPESSLLGETDHLSIEPTAYASYIATAPSLQGQLSGTSSYTPSVYTSLDGDDSPAQHIMGDVPVPPTISASRPLARAPAGVTLPSGPEQVRLINQLKNGTSLVLGDAWYLVATPWYKTWQAHSSGEASEEKGDEDWQMVAAGPDGPGPITNASLSLDARGRLEGTPEEEVDYIPLPERAWQLLLDWYGLRDYEIKRSVISTRTLPGNEQLECIPPSIILYLIRDAGTYIYAEAGDSGRSLSAASTVQTLVDFARRAYSLSATQKLRFWRLLPDSARSSAASLATLMTGAELVGDGLDGVLEPEENLLNATLAERWTPLAVEVAHDNGAWVLPTDSEGVLQLASSLPTSQPVLAGSRGFFSTSAFPTSSGPTASTSQINSLVAKRNTHGMTSSRDSSPAGTEEKLGITARLLRSHAASTGRSRGLTGLGNLGNTCFMNSALQCLSNTPELQRYFTSGAYKSELNPDNPLGMNGEVAEAFGQLMQRIWTGGSNSYTPREFKAMIGRFRPVFLGWQQQDSQELLAFLLDGLHEDLNRIKKKPYVEQPDWTGGDDEELMNLAKTSWDQYKSRNDSIIVDLFQGQYTSKVVCPDCAKVSITFDPFMYLTLQLPSKTWIGHVYFVPMDPAKPLLKFMINMPGTTTISQIKAYIAARTGIDARKMMSVEVYNRRFFKWWSDDEVINDIKVATDSVMFFEIPVRCLQQTAAPYSRRSSLIFENDDYAILPVAHRRPSSRRTGRMYKKAENDLFGLPFVAAFKKSEMPSIDQISDYLLKQYARQNQRQNVSQHDPDQTAHADTQQTSLTDKPGEQTAPRPRFTLLVPQETADRPPTDASALETALVSLEARIDRESRPQKAAGIIPGAFEQEDDSELNARYATDDAATASPATDAAGQGPTIVRTGDHLLVDWDDEAYDAYFGDAPTPNLSETAQLNALFTVYQEPESGDADSKTGLTIDKCLKDFTRAEQLTEDNAWYCSRCKKHQQAEKKIDLWKTPDVLVIHLKRFSNVRYSRDKITDFVDFPIEGLDLEQHVLGRKTAERLRAEKGADYAIDEALDEPLLYDLFAVDNHYGGMGGGHYTAYAQNVEDGKWYNYDDSHVSPVGAANAVKTQAAYLLFYRRRTHRIIGGKSIDVVNSAIHSRDVSQNGSRAPSSAGDLEMDDEPVRRSGYRARAWGPIDTPPSPVSPGSNASHEVEIGSDKESETGLRLQFMPPDDDMETSEVHLT